MAAQRAVVKSEHAIIYGEIDKVTPIGYVSRGKTLRVGSVAKGSYRMLPIVVSGKVCWIQEADLLTPEHYTGVPETKKSQMPETITESSKDYNVKHYIERKNALELSYNSFSAGDEWSSLSMTVNGRESSTRVSNLSLRYFFMQSNGFNFGAGLDQFGASDGEASFGALAVAADVNKVLWERGDWSFKPNFSFFMSPSLSSGVMGFKTNAPILYQLTERGFLKAGLGYQRATVKGVNSIPGTTVDLTVAGFNFLIGAEYLF